MQGYTILFGERCLYNNRYGKKAHCRGVGTFLITAWWDVLFSFFFFFYNYKGCEQFVQLVQIQAIPHLRIDEMHNKHKFCFEFYITWLLWTRRSQNYLLVITIEKNIYSGSKQINHIMLVKSYNEIQWTFWQLFCRN